MAFSSGTGNSRRGGLAQSLLPLSSNSPKSKLPRKSRRRVSLRDFIFANFFTIGVAISVLFFIAVFFRFGIPRALTSHVRPRNYRPPKFRKPVYRKPALLEGGKEVASAAIVDITTKDLYDKIEFLDADGGPWTQGWKVTYKGDEWDLEKLKVFVVPHSHNDPGWKLTVDERLLSSAPQECDQFCNTDLPPMFCLRN